MRDYVQLLVESFENIAKSLNEEGLQIKCEHLRDGNFISTIFTLNCSSVDTLQLSIPQCNIKGVRRIVDQLMVFYELGQLDITFFEKAIFERI